MNPFQHLVATWSTFFSVLSQVSATFAGLLFVSLSLRHQALNQPDHRSAKRLAQHTFRGFLHLVIFSLIFLIPNPTAYGISLPLLLVGGYALTKAAQAYREHLSDLGPSTLPPRESAKVYLISIATYSVLLVVSLLLLFGWLNSVYLVVGLLIWHLARITFSTWGLLIELQA